jgi:hypothetical protein
MSKQSLDWYQSNTGNWILRTDAEARLRREIRDQKRASYDEFRKWTTLFLATLGFVLGFTSFFIKQKQPDPCPRNYYRNDAGACIFALAPKTQAAPSEKPPPEKHSDKQRARSPWVNQRIETTAYKSQANPTADSLPNGEVRERD